MEPLRIGVYHWSQRGNNESGRPMRTHMYYFFVHPKNEFPDRLPAGLRRVRVVEPPQFLSRDLQRWLTERPIFDFPKILGKSLYEVTRRTAVSKNYGPKNVFPVEYGGRGLGYLLSHASESNLRRRGVTHFSSSASPSEERIKQLRKVGLTPGRKYSAGRWLLAMRRGIKLARQRAGEK